MATNVGKSKNKTKKEIESITLCFGEKEIKLGTFAVVNDDTVRDNPFNFNAGSVKIHKCIYNAREKLAKRIMEDGTEIPADAKKFKKIAEQRKENKNKENEDGERS